MSYLKTVCTVHYLPVCCVLSVLSYMLQILYSIADVPMYKIGCSYSKDTAATILFILEGYNRCGRCVISYGVYVVCDGVWNYICTIVIFLFWKRVNLLIVHFYFKNYTYSLDNILYKLYNSKHLTYKQNWEHNCSYTVHKYCYVLICAVMFNFYLMIHYCFILKMYISIKNICILFSASFSALGFDWAWKCDCWHQIIIQSYDLIGEVAQERITAEHPGK